MRLQQCMNAIHGNGKWMGDFDSFVEKKKKKNQRTETRVSNEGLL